MKSYAEAAGVRDDVNPRVLKEDELDWDEKKLRKYHSTIEKEGTNGKLIMPEDEKRKYMNKTVIFRTFSIKNRRIERERQEEIEEILLSNIGEGINFFTRGKEYGTIAVSFATEEDAVLNDEQTTEGKKWMLIPGPPGKRIVKVRVIDPEWVIVETFDSNLWRGSKKLGIYSVNRTENMNFRRYGVEVICAVTQEYYEKLPETVELPSGERLEVMLAGRPPKCYKCGGREHLKRQCLSEETEMLEKELEREIKQGETK
ncbi:XP_014783152.1PREDICTED: uncharacterized protein LOC106878453 [Octopus vulgaris]|uniref:XP_014783152.1PREDICTED: uncharacterized protein LOC106878453 n=1 Tax=Octopus vulgaris TaxID=6645 RepID=A0AA36F003_OCTVU|nr:XP_014783152.1PREDICTED: uncharacterized protein LOC106878453 [Octopus vulgaris]